MEQKKKLSKLKNDETKNVIKPAHKGGAIIIIQQVPTKS